jgi:hypothetical protein
MGGAASDGAKIPDLYTLLRNTFARAIPVMSTSAQSIQGGLHQLYTEMPICRFFKITQSQQSGEMRALSLQSHSSIGQAKLRRLVQVLAFA